MPDRPTALGYLAGASLAAIVAIYVYGPTYLQDNETASSRKRNVVGLTNPANDCFINSVLQALAGLSDLRLYLIRELHRRKLDGPEVYLHLVVDPSRKNMPQWKIEGLQAGLVTQGLKTILDRLNERPISKKSISAAPFVQVLEAAFKQRISRQQQDAQEFLQVVAERLCDEYHAGHRARKHARKGLSGTSTNGESSAGSSRSGNSPDAPNNPMETVDQKLNQLVLVDGEEPQAIPDDIYPKEDGFPLEGVTEQQIECQTCGFQPKSVKSTFVQLTLSVPERNTSLSSMFDQMFKREFIEDYKCEKCRLQHAVETFEHEVSVSNSEKFRKDHLEAIAIINNAIETNPEQEFILPADVALRASKFAPKRKISRHVEISEFPKILALHLSRSIHDQPGRSTTKNSSKVNFLETLRLGGLVDGRNYRLSSIVCHKGSHQSGHYETFRRQSVPQHFSTPNAFQKSAVYSIPPTPNPSTPQVGAVQRPADQTETSTLSSTPELLSPSSASSSSPSLPHTNGHVGNCHTLSSGSASNGVTHPLKNLGPTSAPRDSETSSIRSLARSTRSSLSKISKSKASSSSTASPNETATEPNPSSQHRKSVETTGTGRETNQTPKKRKHSNRWVRISDEKVKDAKTSDVLAMQREVYLLFYELETAE